MSGQEGNEQGLLNELKVVRIINEGEKPKWLYKAYKGDDSYDRRGIDVVVFTDVGKLFLQVKSSPKEARLFRRMYEKRVLFGVPPIAVVTVKSVKSEDQIRSEILYLLYDMRQGKKSNSNKIMYSLPVGFDFKRFSYS